MDNETLNQCASCMYVCVCMTERGENYFINLEIRPNKYANALCMCCDVRLQLNFGMFPKLITVKHVG